ALDDALKDVILKHPDRIVKVNATRMLAIACKSGAHAHYPTVTALITQPEIQVNGVMVPIPPEVKYYALQAAGNLLAAHNLASYNAIQGAYLDRNHSIDVGPIAALVLALQNAVLDPGSLIDIPPKMPGVPREIPPAQKPLPPCFPRQAIRALAQVRFAMVPAPNKQFLSPSQVLARVAVSDPALVAAPRPDEVAEAIIGICNMDPPDRTADKAQYGAGAAEVIATGILTFRGDSVPNPPRQAVPGRGSATRVLDAVSRWRARLDGAVKVQVLNIPSFDPDRAGAFNPDAVPPQVIAVFDRSRKLILDPIANKSGQVNVEGMRTFLLQ